MTRIKATVAALLIAMAPFITLAQGTESLSGEVKDAKGQALHGVLVSAKRNGKTVTVLTKFDGKYAITELEAGPYALTAVRESYVAAAQTVTLPASTAVNFTLKAGPADRSRLSMSDMDTALPAGPYKEQLINCQICHSWNGLASQKPHRTQDWVLGMKQMVAKGFAKLSDEDIPKMAEYLQASFGPESNLNLALPPEPVDERGLNIKYMAFDIPSYHAMPHTAVPDGQGNVWFTEYGASKIGVLHPKTGQMEEFVLPTKVTPSPHNVVRDQHGMVWFTEQTAGNIGRFDPATKTFKEFAIPAPKNKPQGVEVVETEGANMHRAVAPHTLVPDNRGHIWFTSAANPLMELNPETGAVIEHVIRPGGGGLYGVTNDVKRNRIWYAGIGLGEVGYVDPGTGKVTHFPMLTANAGPRRIHVDSNGVAWCNLYNVSKIARIDPATGKVTEWNLPGDRDGRPYALGLDSKERVWTTTYRDDRLHMFDPKTEKFISYLMPTKGNGMRDFSVDENGWVWAAAWGHNQVVGFKLDEAR